MYRVNVPEQVSLFFFFDKQHMLPLSKFSLWSSNDTSVLTSELLLAADGRLQSFSALFDPYWNIYDHSFSD